MSSPFMPQGESLRPPSSSGSLEQSLLRYASALVREDELSSLILELEDWQLHHRETSLSDPGFRGLLEGAGMNPHEPEEVKQAILVLGQRFQQLRGRRHNNSLSQLPTLTERDPKLIAQSLMTVLEAERLEAGDSSTLLPRLHEAANEALDVYRRNLPARTKEEIQWWTSFTVSVHERLVPGFARTAEQLERLEKSAFYSAILRSPLLMGVLAAVPGILTVEMPVSTPLVMVLLAVLGALVVHPWWLKQVSRPLVELEAHLASEGETLATLTSDEPCSEEAFSLQQVISDLLPMLEGARLAGRADEAALQAVIDAYFDQLEARRVASNGCSPRYFEHLRELVTGYVARRFAHWAASRELLERGKLLRVLDNQKACALVAALITFPLSYWASRVTPLPVAVDMTMMISLFSVVGYFLPRWVWGTAPSRQTFVEEVASHQGELAQLP